MARGKFIRLRQLSATAVAAFSVTDSLRQLSATAIAALSVTTAFLLLATSLSLCLALSALCPFQELPAALAIYGLA